MGFAPAQGLVVPEVLPLGHVEGGRLAFVSVTTVSIGTAGQTSQVRDFANTFNISWSGTLSADITVSGAGGLDTGVEAPNTWYAVHVIGDTSTANAPDALLSLSATAPTLPAGYDAFRRLGWVRNDAASNLIDFRQRGEGKDRSYWWDPLLLALAGGAAVVFTPVSLAAFMPPTSEEVQLMTLFDNSLGGAGDLFFLRPAGSLAALTPWAGLIGVVITALFHSSEMRMPTDSAQTIEYQVSNPLSPLTLAVQGFEDEL